jgi:hypothetical protein
LDMVKANTWARFARRGENDVEGGEAAAYADTEPWTCRAATPGRLS